MASLAAAYEAANANQGTPADEDGVDEEDNSPEETDTPANTESEEGGGEESNVEAIFNPNIGIYSGKTTIVDSSGDVLGEFTTGNNTTEKSRGPTPPGIYPVGEPVPIVPNGDGNRDGVPDGVQFGPYAIPIQNVPGRTGIYWHGGRSGPSSRTEGCLRSGNADIREIVEIYNRNPITQITVLPE